jgi:hypothetical protein
MTSATENIAEKLFKVIKGFGHPIVLFTDDGKKTIDPTEARRFFATDLQMMVNLIVDETTKEVAVNLSKDTDINEVKPMLNSIRTLANQFILNYTVKTFGKTIGPKDFSFMAKQKTNETIARSGASDYEDTLSDNDSANRRAYKIGKQDAARGYERNAAKVGGGKSSKFYNAGFDGKPFRGAGGMNNALKKAGYFYSGDKNKDGWREYSRNDGSAYWIGYREGWKNTDGESGSNNDDSLIKSLQSKLNERDKSNNNTSRGMNEAREMTRTAIMKKINDGEWEATQDVKPGKHCEIRNTTNGKKMMVMVKESKAIDRVDETTDSQMKKRKYDRDQRKLATLSKERNAAKKSGNTWKANDPKEREYYALKSQMNEGSYDFGDMAFPGTPMLPKDHVPFYQIEHEINGEYDDGYDHITVTYRHPKSRIFRRQKDPLGLHNKTYKETSTTSINDIAKALISKISQAGGKFVIDIPDIPDDSKNIFTDRVPKDVEEERSSRHSSEIKEGFSGWHGSAMKSINELGDAKLIVRHKRTVDEEKRGARTRQIESIFIENNEGERFKFPSNNITAAKAMVRHVKEGGTPYDDFGQYIYETMEELNQLKVFQRKNRRNDFFEDANISEEIGGRVTQLRTNLKQIAGVKGYAHHFESFAREGAEVDKEKLDELKDNVTISYFDEAISDSLPYVARVIENMRGRQAREADIVDLARYVMDNKDNIEFNSELDETDPESPGNRKFRDPATAFAAWVTYIQSKIKDDVLANKLMQAADVIHEVSGQHVKMAAVALKVVRQKGKVSEDVTLDSRDDSVYESEVDTINETMSRLSDTRHLFGA